MSTVQLLSVNVGTLTRRTPESRKRTGIHKRPVAYAVHCGVQGLDGDRVGDTRHHGGADQAVYLYSQEDYDWWSATLGDACTPGMFGDNLTIDRWWPTPRVGDRLVFGDVELELTAPRIPCATLAARMDDPHFVQPFAAANRTGAYARVITPGTLSAGVTGTYVQPRTEWPTIRDMATTWYAKSVTPEAMQSMLAAPIATRFRATTESRRNRVSRALR